MNDPNLPSPKRSFPIRLFLALMLGWGVAFVAIDVLLDCASALGLNAPQFAALVNTLGFGGMVVIAGSLAGTPSALKPRVASHARDSADETSEAEHLVKGSVMHWKRFGMTLLMQLLLVAFAGYTAVRAYERTVVRIESGDCRAADAHRARIAADIERVGNELVFRESVA